MELNINAACPDDGIVAELGADQLEPRARGVVLAHLDSCESCRSLVGELLLGEDEPEERGLAPGDRIGRYVIDRVLGAGGSGVVYAAYDAQLARAVALKLLRATVVDNYAVLLDEAQTLARLSHPNLVTVYDVGTVSGRWFIAMELVAGQTLRSWLAAAPRSWGEIRGVFVQAARGLEAAHAAGVIHRDFKPDNVLVGDDGRVRVTDFGLAHRTADETVTASREAGKAVGTPAYMAPEQRTGSAVDERADVYSYCVTLFEALHGHRAARDERVTEGPRRLRPLLERGLAATPDDRPASMTEILAELSPGMNLRRMAILALAIVCAFTATAFALGRVLHDPCAGAEVAWGTLWDESQRALAAGRLSPRIYAETDGTLSHYHAGWLDARRAVCLAGVHEQVPAGVVDRRMTCLDDRRRDAEAAMLLLTTGDVSEHAIDLVHGLAPVTECVGLAGPSLLPATAAGRATLARLSTRLAEIKVDVEIARYPECLAAAAAMLDEAKAFGDPSILAPLFYYRARCEADDREIRADLQAAGVAAIAAHDDRTLAWTWIRMIYFEGYHLAHWDEADRWEVYARAAVERLGGDRELELAFERNRLLNLDRRGRVDEALALAETLHRTVLDMDGPDSTLMARTEELWGNVYSDAWRPTEAILHHRRAVEIYEENEGDEARDLNYALENLAVDLNVIGRCAEALAIHDRVRALPTYPIDDSWFRTSRAAALRGVGRVSEALDEDRAAAATCEHYAGVGAARCTMSWEGVGRDLVALCRLDEGAEILEKVATEPVDEQSSDLGWELAKAVVLSDPERAQRLAMAARDHMASLVGDRVDDQQRLHEIEAWLKEHP